MNVAVQSEGKWPSRNIFIYVSMAVTSLFRGKSYRDDNTFIYNRLFLH